MSGERKSTGLPFSTDVASTTVEGNAVWTRNHSLGGLVQPSRPASDTVLCTVIVPITAAE